MDAHCAHFSVNTHFNAGPTWDHLFWCIIKLQYVLEWFGNHHKGKIHTQFAQSKSSRAS